MADEHREAERMRDDVPSTVALARQGRAGRGRMTTDRLVEAIGRVSDRAT
jgi:hypothetical protein